MKCDRIVTPIRINTAVFANPIRPNTLKGKSLKIKKISVSTQSIRSNTARIAGGVYPFRDNPVDGNDAIRQDGGAVASDAENRIGICKEILSIILPYPPAGATGNHAVRHGKRGHYLSDAAQTYRAQVNIALAQQHGKRRLEGPLVAEWRFFPPDRRARDSDNVRKTLADALTMAGLWVDDSNRVIRREVFEWGDVVKGGKVELRILAYNDEKTA